MRVVTALLTLMALACSCSRRERANPLDAGNPLTGGAPQDFNAAADHAFVQLRWSPQPDLTIDGFQLFRLAPGDSSYQPLGPVLPNVVSSYFDGDVQSGREYRYRLYFVIQGALAARSAEDVATPGPLRPWVVDALNGRLLRLSPDGRDVLQARSGFGGAASLAVTPGFGPLWVADELAGIVDVVNPGDFTGPRLSVPEPFTIALDPFDGSGWICDLAGVVRHYQASGAPGFPAAISLLQAPEGVATSAGDSTLWITERTGARVRRYALNGTPLGARALLNPMRVAVDSTTGQGWVTSALSGYVWRLSPALVVLDSLRLAGPLGVALDWYRRTAWLADPVGDELVALNMDTRAVRFRIGGLDSPRDVAVDLATGEAWVVSAVSGRAYRVSPAGTVLASVGGLGEPAEVRLDPGIIVSRVAMTSK